ncbi:hypothetical protein M948_00325 [Virgibacillus sp. CM-4]|nr:hypothetical protein M948_00325 [Virgibacillus sp. CM-4]
MIETKPLLPLRILSKNNKEKMEFQEKKQEKTVVFFVTKFRE